MSQNSPAGSPQPALQNVSPTLEESARPQRHEAVPPPIVRTEQDLADFIDNAAIGLHWVGEDGKVLWANQAELDLLGYSREEYLGREISDFHADSDVIQDILQRLQRNETLHNYEARLRAKDGSTRDVLISSNVLRRDGKFIHTRCFTRDITDRKKAEQESQRLLKELAAESAKLKAVLAQMPSAVAIVEAPSGMLLLANEQNEAIFRQRNVPMSGIPEYRRFTGLHPDGKEIQPHEWPLSRSIATGEVVKGEEIHIIRGDGTHGYIRVNSAPVRNEQGQTVAGVVTYDDVTEQKLSDEQRKFLLEASALLASSLDYSKTLNTIAQLAVPKIADWCAIEIGNDPATSKQVAAAHVDPVKLASAQELNRRYPPDRNAPSGVSNVLRTGKPEFAPEIPAGLLEAAAQDAEHLRLIREMGLKSYMIVPLKARGRILGAITFISAESQQSYGPMALAFAEELANCAALAVDNARLYEDERKRAEFEQQLVGIVSHDLRNPISAIMMTGQVLLKREDLDQGTAKNVGRILSSAARANRMIRDLLDFTQARLGGGIPVEPQLVDVGDLVAQAVEEAQLAHPDRKFQIHRGEDGRGEWDGDRLLQVATNLISNAIHYSPVPTTITVKTQGTASHITLEVHNSGDPIPAELRATLFQPMHRGTAKVDKATRSIGLGLFIVDQIVRAHRGTVELQSTVEDGTTFKVHLPRRFVREDVSTGPEKHKV